MKSIIPFLVFCVHMLFVATLLYFQIPEKKMAPHRPIAVRTILERKPIPVTHVATVAPQPQPLPVVEKTAPPKPVVKNNPVAKPVVKKVETKTNQNQDKLIAMLQENLKTLQSGPAAAPAAKSSKPVLGKLASEGLNFALNYEEELMLYLESHILLPEEGDVKLKLTLTKDGNVKQVEIIKSTSERNKKYVETALTALLFPKFEKHFKGQSAHTFSITLKGS